MELNPGLEEIENGLLAVLPTPYSLSRKLCKVRARRLKTDPLRRRGEVDLHFMKSAHILKNRIVTINARKYDGKIHRTWKADLIERKDSLLVFVGKFEKEVKHPDLGVIRRGTVSYEYYWLDRWYNVFRFHEPDGNFRNYYCNVNLPPTFEKNVLNYVDLDIDILVWHDKKIEILDEEEYLANAKRYRYPEKIDVNTRSSIDELSKMIASREFPFDYPREKPR